MKCSDVRMAAMAVRDGESILQPEENERLVKTLRKLREGGL